MRRLLWMIPLLCSIAWAQVGGKAGIGGKGGIGRGPAPSIAIATFIAGRNNAATTTVATTSPNLNMPSGATGFAACMFQGSSSGFTISFADLAGATWSAAATLEFNAAAGSLQTFTTTSTIANAADTGTCTISSSVGGSAAAVVMGYITGVTAQDITSAGNNKDAGSSGTTLTSVAASSSFAAEAVIACGGTSNDQTWTAGTIAGIGATLTTTSDSPTGSPGNGILACETIITSGTFSSQTATMTVNGAVRWDIIVNSFH